MGQYLAQMGHPSTDNSRVIPTFGMLSNKFAVTLPLWIHQFLKSNRP
jgi:hypothetical protein